MADTTLKAFLEETLQLWQVAGTVDSGVTPLAAIIRTENGTTVWIEQLVHPERDGVQSNSAVRPERSTAESKDERPAFRWAVRWRAAGEAPGAPRELRPRLCGSINGVLSALRSAFGVDRGTPVRIAPP